ncbi:MAG: type II toxin-antitoxin system VapC family toxin [Halobacteriota archaeon]
MYVLDTDHCVELLRENRGVLTKLKSLDMDIEVYTTTITAAELFYGAHRMSNPEQRLGEVNAFLNDIDIIDLDLESAKIYGQLKAELSRKGELLADNDLFIASIALSRSLTLVTHNTRHYARIPDLCLEDWLE